LFALESISLLLDEQHGVELVRGYLIEADSNAQLECGAKIECPADQLARFGELRCVEPVEGTVVAAATVIRGIRTQTRIAQFLPPQGPVNQEPEGGLLGPLPV